MCNADDDRGATVNIEGAIIPINVLDNWRLMEMWWHVMACGTSDDVPQPSHDSLRGTAYPVIFFSLKSFYLMAAIAHSRGKATLCQTRIEQLGSVPILHIGFDGIIRWCGDKYERGSGIFYVLVIFSNTIRLETSLYRFNTSSDSQIVPDDENR